MRLLKQLSCVLLVLVFIGCSNGTDSGDEEENGENESSQYSLSVSASPADAGSVEPSSETFNGGSEVTVEATPNEGWSFSDWSGDQTSQDNPFAFTITEDTDLTANFEEQMYSLTATASPTEGGSVDPASGTFQEGSEVSVEATPSEGWSFVNWTGDQESQENPLTFTMSGDTELTANFEDQRSFYTMSMRVIDAEDTVEVSFGQAEDATPGLDAGIDEEAPPPPPEGALNAYFEINDLKLFQDFRSPVALQAEWALKYQIGSGQEVTLEWELTKNNQLPGSLKLSDKNSSFDINMFEEGSHAISSTTSGTLIISSDM